MKYKGHEVTQSGYNNHVMIVKDGIMMAHFSCTEKKTDAELKDFVDKYLTLVREHNRRADHERTKAD